MTISLKANKSHSNLKCANCSESHVASSKNCSIYQNILPPNHPNIIAISPTPSQWKKVPIPPPPPLQNPHLLLNLYKTNHIYISPAKRQHTSTSYTQSILLSLLLHSTVPHPHLTKLDNLSTPISSYSTHIQSPPPLSISIRKNKNTSQSNFIKSTISLTLNIRPRNNRIIDYNNPKTNTDHTTPSLTIISSNPHGHIFIFPP